MDVPDTPPQRILVYGVTGSGKSHTARRVSQRTGLPLIAADDIAWLPGWIPRDPDEQSQIFATIAAEERWVLDTAYSIWLDVVLARVDLVVALDFPRWFSLQRLLRRTARRVHTGEKICNGNIETLRRALTRESIIVWHFRSYARKRKRIRHWSNSTEGPPLIVCRRPRDLDRWLASLS